MKMEIGEYLKHLRTEYGYTQTETAQKIGVTQQTYAKWENGCRNPKPDTLSKIAEAYGLPSNYFIMEQAREESGFAQYGDTCSAIFGEISEKLKSSCTAAQLAEIARCVNAAYQAGKASAGAEMIDKKAVWIDSLQKMISWDSGIPKFVDSGENE